MASLSHDGGRSWRIQIGADKDRKTIRFRGAQRDAERFRDRVERLAASWPSVPADLVEWLNEQPDKTHERLVKARLAEPRRSANEAALGAFLDKLLATIAGTLKPDTIAWYRAVARNLKTFFGEAKPVRTITDADADAWHSWLIQDQKLAPATVARRTVQARTIMKKAIRWGLTARNPFAEIKAGAATNTDRQFFIARDVAEKVLAACPNAQWKLLFGLSRYAGLRCPSETLLLRWGDVDWERNRIRIMSPKTAHHKGRGERTIPLFPELRPLLQDVFDAAEPGTEYVITRYRESRQRIRIQLKRIVVKAGLKPWPRLLHNLRATRQTELVEKFPAHVVSAWLGNTQTVAQNHYLMTLDAHFDRASADPQEAAQKAAHFPAQYGAKLSETERKAASERTQNTPENAGDYTQCASAQKESPLSERAGFLPICRL